MPMTEPGEAIIGDLAIVRGQLRDEVLHALQAEQAAVEMRLELALDEAGGEAAQIEFREEVIAAIPRDIDGLHRAEGAQQFQPLAGGAFAHLEALHAGVHRQSIGGNEEQAVEFADGFWHAQQADKADEKIDGFDLQSGKRGLAGRCFCGGSELGISGHEGGRLAILDKVSIKK